MSHTLDRNTIHERSDAALNRQRILDTASRLFQEYGVENVSMNQIAIEAKIGSGTLYRRFRNKSELCLDLIRDNVVHLFDHMETYLEENQEQTPGQRLTGILDLFVQFREQRTQLLTGVEESDVTPKKEQSQQQMSPLYNQLRDMILPLIEEMYATQSSRPDAGFITDLLLFAIRNQYYRFQREVRGYSPDSFLEQLYLIFIPRESK